MIRTYLDFARALLTGKRLIYGHFAVTHRCNLRCRMCSIWRLADGEHEVDIAGIREIAAILKRLGCIHVSLGGGEPFVRLDLPEIVRAFGDQGIRVRVLTNGVAPNERTIREVVRAGLRDVSISFDTLFPELQADIDLFEHSWRRKIETIAAFSQYLPRRGSLPILNSVISAANLHEAPALVEFADRVGFFVSLIPVHLAPTEADDRYHADAPDMAVTAAHVKRVRDVYRRIADAKRRRGHILNSRPFLEQSERFLATGGMSWRCDAGRLYVSIGPDGGFAICHDYESNPVPYSQFEAFYRSPAYERDRAHGVAHCSGCVRPCWAEVTHLVHDRGTLIENVQRQIMSTRYQMKSWSADELLRIADDLRARINEPATPR